MNVACRTHESETRNRDPPGRQPGPPKMFVGSHKGPFHPKCVSDLKRVTAGEVSLDLPVGRATASGPIDDDNQSFRCQRLDARIRFSDRLRAAGLNDARRLPKRQLLSSSGMAASARSSTMIALPRRSQTPSRRRSNPMIGSDRRIGSMRAASPRGSL